MKKGATTSSFFFVFCVDLFCVFRTLCAFRCHLPANRLKNKYVYNKTTAKLFLVSTGLENLHYARLLTNIRTSN